MVQHVFDEPRVDAPDAEHLGALVLALTMQRMQLPVGWLDNNFPEPFGAMLKKKKQRNSLILENDDVLLLSSK